MFLPNFYVIPHNNFQILVFLSADDHDQGLQGGVSYNITDGYQFVTFYQRQDGTRDSFYFTSITASIPRFYIGGGLFVDIPPDRLPDFLTRLAEITSHPHRNRQYQ